MSFRIFKDAIQRQFNMMKEAPLFRASVDKDKLWDLYLASFPEGSNPKFRERTEHDCSCCRSFIRAVGDMVALQEGKIVSLWDAEVADPSFKIVSAALAELIRSKPVDNIFFHQEEKVGTDKNYETDGDEVLTWEHFYLQLPKALVKREAGPDLSEARARHDVFLRSLQEITDDSIETVLDLIGQNSLYRGAEKKNLVDALRMAKKKFAKLKTASARDAFAWSYVQGPEAWICKVRNDVIGTLLVDLSEGKELEHAVKSFEDKVSGTNYKRPTALITPKMRDAAKQTLTGLGLMPALERRFAVMEDMKISNLLFADRNTRKALSADVFDELPVKGQSQKQLDRVEEVTISDFISNILPKAQGLEVMVENRHTGNLASLTAPVDLTAPSLFKWPNPFAWSYNGDVADSIKERVKKAGGNVDGDVCCRLAWWNTDDLDFHMVEQTRRASNRHEIYYGNRRIPSPNGGILDIDANGCDGIRSDPCENIFYENRSRMADGTYSLVVHQFTKRQTNDVGFEVEIDILGEVTHFSRAQDLKTGQQVHVADIVVKGGEISVVPKMESSTSTKEVWGLKTQTFHPVRALMLSPNFWDEKEIGNKHFLFALEGCKNDGTARGFYNEFLNSALEPHRKAMEIVGSRMRTEESDNQLSGLGFSSTQRNSVLCRVKGSFTRTVKITF
jgi:hypothetical protein